MQTNPIERLYGGLARLLEIQCQACSHFRHGDRLRCACASPQCAGHNSANLDPDVPYRRVLKVDEEIGAVPNRTVVDGLRENCSARRRSRNSRARFAPRSSASFRTPIEDLLSRKCDATYQTALEIAQGSRGRWYLEKSSIIPSTREQAQEVA
jgi:hypothetical protein